jgi:hypothetical protein
VGQSVGYGGFNPTFTRRPDFDEITALDEYWQGRTIAVMLRRTKVGESGARERHGRDTSFCETRHFESFGNNKHLLNRRYGARIRVRASILAKPVRAAPSARKVRRKAATP